ncbi:MAG: exo-alpha-sialidase [Phycisphaeraceae bacterium]|nr:exo-alpha-sialidase [Phycisphaeraceae bacterium]
MPRACADPLFETTTVFTSPSDDHPNYRIPSLVQAANGDLLLIGEKRNSGIGDVGNTDLVLRRSSNLGLSWSSTQVIYDSGIQTHTDATPFVDPDTGQIMLFFLRDKKQFSLMNSNDNGQTWTAPTSIHSQIIPESWDQLFGSYNSQPGDPTGGQSKSEQWETGWYQRYGLGPGGGVVKLTEGAQTGRIIVPARARIPESGITTTFAFYSDDQGSTWNRGGLAVPYGSEAQLVELSGGRVMVNARDADNSHGPDNFKRRIAVSSNGGQTWPQSWLDPYLEDPQVHASIARYQYQGQDLLLFVNPKSSVRTPEHPYGRVNLSVQVSMDEGQTWPIARTIYPYAASYSDIAVLNDGTIGVVYERGPNNSSTQYWGELQYARFNLDWLMAGWSGAYIDRDFNDQSVNAAPAGALLDVGGGRVVIADSTITPADPFGPAGNCSLLIADESTATLSRVAFTDSTPANGITEGTISFKWYDVEGTFGSFTYAQRNNVNLGYVSDPTSSFVSVTGSPIYLRAYAGHLEIRSDATPDAAGFTTIVLDPDFAPNVAHDVQVDFVVDETGWGYYSVWTDGVLRDSDGVTSFGFQSTMPAGMGINQAAFAAGFSSGISAFFVDDILLEALAALDPGDANGDGMVNLSDLQILGDNWQSTTATWAEADFTGDGVVNLADLQIIGDNWGYGSGADLTFGEALAQRPGAGVPEPVSLALLLIPGAVALLRRRAANR